MAWTIEDRFPSWGESGEFPVSGFFYDGGDQVNEKHLDALWNGVNGLEDDIQAALSDIDSDEDGIVDEAESGSDGFTFLGDVTVADGEVLWDETESYIPQARLENDSLTVAGNLVSLNGSTGIALGDLSNVTASGEGSGNGFDADTVDGEDASAFADATHDNASHSTNYTTLTEVNNNADVPNADYADNAGDADTVDGQHASQLGKTLSETQFYDTASSSTEGTQYQTITTVSGVTAVMYITADLEVDVSGGSGTADTGYTTLRVYFHYTDGSSSLAWQSPTAKQEDTGFTSQTVNNSIYGNWDTVLGKEIDYVELEGKYEQDYDPSIDYTIDGSIGILN